MYPARTLHGVPRGRGPPAAPWRGAGPLPRTEGNLYMDSGGAVAKSSAKVKRVRTLNSLPPPVLLSVADAPRCEAPMSGFYYLYISRCYGRKRYMRSSSPKPRCNRGAGVIPRELRMLQLLPAQSQPLVGAASHTAELDVPDTSGARHLPALVSAPARPPNP